MTPLPGKPRVGPAGRVAGPAPARAPLAQPRRILVADDEHLVATALVLSLAELGFTVVGPASDGLQAVQLARLALPDIALLDIRMPRRDGIDAAREIFADLAIPVVIVSAYSDPTEVAGAGAAGVFGYLVKPVSTEQLRAAIEVAWDRFNQLLAVQSENSDLRRRLEERKLIEQAKWVLVKQRSMTEPDAMDLLRETSRASRRAMIEVARETLQNVGQGR